MSQIYVSEEHHERLTAIATEHRVPVSQLLAAMVDLYAKDAVEAAVRKVAEAAEQKRQERAALRAAARSPADLRAEAAGAP